MHYELASCLIYARALLEFVIIMWLRFFHDVTFREIRRKKGARFLYSP